MTQSTYFNQVKNVLKVLQGYTKGIRFIALLTMLCTIGVGQVWGETFNEFYAYADKGSTWNLTECTDKSSYWLVPSGSNPSVASIDGLFEGKTITSDVKITINHATFGSGNNPSESTFTVYNSSSCSVVVESTKSGSLANISTYAKVIYTVAKNTAVASLTNDLAIKITKPGKQIRLQSITVEFEYTTSGTTPEPEPEPGTGGELVGEQTATYVVSTATAVTTSGFVPDGSSASLSGTGSLSSGFIQCTNGKNHTLTLKGYAGYKIKSISIHVKSNSSKGTGSFSVVAGSTTIASIAESAFNTANWNGSWNNSGVDKVLTMTNDSYEIQSGEDVKLTINCKSGSSNYNSLYIKSYTIVYESTSTGGETPEPETPATELTDAQFAWSAATAEATMGASNTFPNLTNTVPVSVTYESSTPATATIDATSGAITLVAPGTTTISATFAGGEVSGTTYAAKTVSYTLTVKPAPLVIEPIEGGIIDILKIEDLEITGSGSYTYFSDKQASNTGHSNAVYAGTAARNGTATKYNIQLNSGATNSKGRQIATTTSGGLAKRVYVRWATQKDNTNNRYLTIYGKNEAYDGVETEASGTEIGKITYTTGSAEAYVDLSSDCKYIKIGASDAIYMDEIQITWIADQSALTAPTFTPAAGTYNAVQNVTISAEAGTNIYYTLDGTEPTKASAVYSTPIEIAETKTLKAIAVKDEKVSPIASAKYTINLPLTTMDQIFAKATAVGSTATSVEITFDNWVVSAVKEDGKTAFVTDGTKGFAIFDKDVNLGFSVGNTLSGTATCKVQLYNGFAELTELKSNTAGLSVSTGGTITTQELDVTAIEALTGVNTGSLIKINGICSSTELKYYVAGVQIYTSLYNFGTLEVGAEYNITGIYQQYHSTKEMLPRSAEDIEEIQEPLTTYNVNWLVNGDELADSESVKEGTKITSLPEDPTDECGGKTFVGWSNQEVTDGNKPAVLFTDVANSPTISDNTTFHAVFADKEGDGESGWQKVIATDEVVDGGIFALLTYDEAYYLANAQSTSDPLLQTVTKQDGKITVTDEMKWRATAVGGGFTFTSYNNANYYLWGAHANDGIRINTESTKQSPTNVWSIELSNDYGVVLYHNASNEGKKYLSTYGDNDWRNYLISNINESNRVANLYKEYIGTTYSEYTTSCLEKLTYTVTWMVNGKEYTEGTPSTTVYADERVATLPTPPEPNAYCGDVFVGWTTENPASGNFNEAPTVYNEQSAFPLAKGNQTFYAVFADYEN